jgi:ABC-2 type transport system permease protein
MAILSPKKPASGDGEEKRKDQTVLVAGANSATRHNVRNIRLIIGREYFGRVRKKSFILGTAAIMIGIILASLIPTIITLFVSNSQTKLAIINNAGTVSGDINPVSYFDTRLNLSIDPTTGQPRPADPNRKPSYVISNEPQDKLEDVRQRIRDGKLDGALLINRNGEGTLSYEYLNNNSGTSSGTSTSLNQIRSIANELSYVDKLGKLGIPQSQLAQLNAQAPFTATSLKENEKRSPGEILAAYLVTTAAVTILFILILQYGMAVAQGAVEEKSNRVMEIMVNAATPFQLMMGKIVGIGLVGTTQMALVGIAGLVAFFIQSPVRDVLLTSGGASAALPTMTGGVSLGWYIAGLVALALTFFVLGFILFATIYAAIGSLLSRSEEIQSAVSPITFLFIAVFYSAIFGLNIPDAPWLTVLSYIPFFTPFAMMVRAAMGTAQLWEVFIGIGILLVSVPIMVWFAGRIYRAGVLMYGQKAGFGKLLKLAFRK